jgi:hypothetical protein
MVLQTCVINAREMTKEKYGAWAAQPQAQPLGVDIAGRACIDIAFGFCSMIILVCVSVILYSLVPRNIIKIYFSILKNRGRYFESMNIDIIYLLVS